MASAITSVQGPWRANRRCRRRAVLTSRAAAEPSQPQSAGLPAPGFAGQGRHRQPGQQVGCELDDLQPDLMLRALVQGQVAQAGGTRMAYALLRPRAWTVPQFQLRDLPARCVTDLSDELSGVTLMKLRAIPVICGMRKEVGSGPMNKLPGNGYGCWRQRVLSRVRRTR